MNNIINVTEQMELGFHSTVQRPLKRRQPTRIEHAAWWFGKMRAAVDNAMTWSAKSLPQSEQIWLPQTHRQAGA